MLRGHLLLLTVRLPTFVRYFLVQCPLEQLEGVQFLAQSCELNLYPKALDFLNQLPQHQGDQVAKSLLHYL